MKNFLVRVVTYMATNKKARAAEYLILMALVEAVRNALGHP